MPNPAQHRITMPNQTAPSYAGFPNRQIADATWAILKSEQVRKRTYSMTVCVTQQLIGLVIAGLFLRHRGDESAIDLALGCTAFVLNSGYVLDHSPFTSWAERSVAQLDNPVPLLTREFIRHVTMALNAYLDYRLTQLPAATSMDFKRSLAGIHLIAIAIDLFFATPKRLAAAYVCRDHNERIRSSMAENGWQLAHINTNNHPAYRLVTSDIEPFDFPNTRPVRLKAEPDETRN